MKIIEVSVFERFSLWVFFSYFTASLSFHLSGERLNAFKDSTCNIASFDGSIQTVDFMNEKPIQVYLSLQRAVRPTVTRICHARKPTSRSFL